MKLSELKTLVELISPHIKTLVSTNVLNQEQADFIFNSIIDRILSFEDLTYRDVDGNIVIN